ncbi:spondin domain-containing protein [Haloarchaeobius baliensis]|uniref:spondin domain-containing protein n=1 Tax=Haloarchaeobius baliensis TaxID=1670458 RepID=UPI003F880BD4
MTTGARGLPMTRRTALATAGATLGGLALGGVTLTGAQDGGNQSARTYRVTVTNLTPGQPFTPPLVAAHRPDVEVFAVGDQANEPTRQLAENGNLGPLVDLAGSTNSIRGAAAGASPLVPEADPGETGLPYYDTVHLTTDASAGYLTFASMLVATNDGITGLDTVPLPEDVNESRTYYANGYDVGTERNTELFADLVPPAKTLIVGGEPEGTTESDPALAENGVIRPHPGIQGDGDLDPAVYGWREPAAMVQVERLEGLQEEFGATLRGTSEVPPVETDAMGSATFELDRDGDELDYEVSVENIENVVAAHIHCGASDANGPPGVTLFDGGPVSPDGVLAEGTITEPDDDNGCGWESLDDVVTALRGDYTYVNVHTQANPGGEVRGQIV